ncbi:MAG: hypothetical protein U0M60_05875 [Clostridia bacterium]|nr:hypothetical protein [Clostridia bacterium]
MNFSNTTGEDLDVYLIIARYGKNGLFSEPLEIKNIKADKAYGGVEYNYNIDAASLDADRVKIFAWSDMTGRMPLKEAAEIK